ncbi:MAG: RNA methyltransferase [Cyanobacteria bacterium P01_A01_bin.68]
MALGNISNQTQLLKLESNAAKINEIRKLQTHRTYRDSTKQFYIEGVRNFIRIVDNKFDISTIIYSEKLHEISIEERTCWIILETIRSPGNLGTLIRTSEAFGGAGFILLGNSIDPFDPNVVRASMGSIYNQKFIRTGYSKLHKWLQNHNCHIIGASPDGTVDFHQFNYPTITMIFLGEERRGLTQQQRDLCKHLVRIPIARTVDSLNLAVAGSLIMYEIYRIKNPVNS